MPYVRPVRTYCSEPTRNHPRLTSVAASAQTQSRSYGPELEVLGGACPEPRQQLAEANELIVLRLLLGGPEIRVVEVLPTTGGVDPGCLQPGGRGRRDPDVLPRGWDDELLDPLEALLVADSIPATVEVAERLASANTLPAASTRHGYLPSRIGTPTFVLAVSLRARLRGS